MFAIAVLGFRLMAVYFIFTGLLHSGQLLAPLLFMKIENYPLTLVYPSYLFGINFVLGVLLWFVSRPLGKLVVKSFPETKLHQEEKNWIAMGTFLIGLFWVVDHSGQIIFQVGYFSFAEPESYSPPITSVVFNYEILYSNMAAVLVGLVVMLSAFKISNLFHWLRKAT